MALAGAAGVTATLPGIGGILAEELLVNVLRLAEVIRLDAVGTVLEKFFSKEFRIILILTRIGYILNLWQTNRSLVN